MNRLQKKCVIATAGFHLLLLVILFVGPAFFNSKPKVDDSQVLDVIPANLIDAAFNSGVKGAQPPPPTPIVTPPRPQPTPTPPAPKPVVQPAPAPQPTLVQKIEKIFTPEPVNLAPKPVENTPKVNLNLVTRTAPKTSTETKTKDNSQAAKNAAQSLRNQLSPRTTVDMPGEGSVAYANYDSAVLSIYDKAWISPDGMMGSEAVVKVKVIISRDGTVISAAIVELSGDPKVDQSVQQALNRVTQVRPFPEGAKEDQRTIEFNFRPRAKSLNE
jgi:protein TonB